MYVSEAAEIRRLLAAGWRYSTRGIQHGDDRYRPYLKFRRNGVDHEMHCPTDWRTERSAWLWCDAWAERAIRWDEQQQHG